jgi:diguanylate cyclase (GGDEF)-like protein
MKILQQFFKNQETFMSRDNQSQSSMAYDKKKFEELCDIIENERIYPVFQPIIDLRNGSVFGYEALTRLINRSIIQNPEDLFQCALQYDQTARLEKLCRKKAILKAHELNLSAYLAINICPSILRSSQHEKGTTAALLQEFSTIKNQIILELTERYYIKNYDLFKKTVDYYRNQGFRMAIDDLGAGSSDLKMLSKIEPYMVKIDGFLISDIHKSIKKQRLLKALVTFCHDVNALITAECVEKKEELDILIDMQVDFAQGYLLGKPKQTLTHCNEKVYETIIALKQKRKISGNMKSDSAVGSLMQYVDPVHENDTVESVSKRFKNNETISTIPVLSGKTPVGIINKREMFYKLGQKFGYDLFARKTVKRMVEDALIFDFNTPIENVSQRVLNRDEKSIYDAVIVVRNGFYAGLVKIHHILERMTEQKIKLAQQANPLTGLPGNMLIKENIETRLSNKQVFVVMYFDLDHFKPFNDNFGFEQGDCVLQFLGALLKNKIKEFDSKSFIGHVGGDDFIAVCRAQGSEQLCRSIIESFDEGIKNFHDRQTCEKGCYQSKDRKGHTQQFNILSLSIAVISTRERMFHSYGHIASIASEVKKKAKSIKGSCYYMDQRLNGG